MQLQSDLLDAEVLIPDCEELSGIGVAYLAGLTQGVYNDSVFSVMKRKIFSLDMQEEIRQKKCSGWKDAIGLTLR